MKRFLVLLGVLVLMLGWNAYAEGDVSEGYVFYENELFSTEAPADWIIHQNKAQVFYDELLEPDYAQKDRYCVFLVSEVTYGREDVEKLEASYDFEHKFYEMTIDGQTALVVERNFHVIGTVQRDVYASTPEGRWVVMRFGCPASDTPYDFSPIQEAMDHFIDNIQWK